MSATQRRSGAAAVKSRSTRSGAGRASRSRMVVRVPLRRLTPAKPSARFRGQAILAMTVIALGLGNPVADRLRRRLELLRQLFRVPPGSHHLNEPSLELRRVRWSGFGHRDLLFPRKGFGVHETGGTSEATTRSLLWPTLASSSGSSS